MALKSLVFVSLGVIVALFILLFTRQQMKPDREMEFASGNTIVVQTGNITTNLTTTVTISGSQLLVNGEPFLIRGIGYAPTPIGDDPETTSPNGDYFTVDYDTIYKRDLPLLRQMGANTIRLWGWKYNADHTDFLDEAYNNGTSPVYVIVAYWLDSSRNISDPVVRQAIIDEFTEMVEIHKNHPAVLMWAIGNELNASWMFGDSDDLFSLINEMAEAAHTEEGQNFHPVTTPLADVSLIDTISNRDAEVPDLDVWSVQVYRGNSFGNLFDEYKSVSNKPLAITEYGVDAYDDQNGEEYENLGTPYQAVYTQALWEEIAANSDICIGGSIMAYSDEWWKGKHGQTNPQHPDCPDYNPSNHSACGYANSAHPDGYANEEWWGIMRTMDDSENIDIMQPRTAYYTLQSLWVNSIFLPIILK